MEPNIRELHDCARGERHSWLIWFVISDRARTPYYVASPKFHVEIIKSCKSSEMRDMVRAATWLHYESGGAAAAGFSADSWLRVQLAAC